MEKIIRTDKLYRSFNSNVNQRTEYEVPDLKGMKLEDAISEYYDKGISQVLVFEGVDAAGKDGAIERIIKFFNDFNCSINHFRFPCHIPCPPLLH